jgi:hypothetical protein
MGFLGFFDSKTSQPAPVAATTPAPGTNAPAPANPFELTPPPAPEGSPVPEFKNLWEPIAAPQVDPNAPPAVPAFNDPQRIADAAKGMDFTKIIPQDVFAKIQNGGSEANTALAEALNLVAQASYAQSHYASANTVKDAIAQARMEFQKEIPNIIRQHNVNDTLRGTDTRYQDPEIAPLLKAIDSQITLKYPEATAAQIAEMRTQYLDRVAGKFSPPKPAPVTKDPRNGDVEDWDALMMKGF